MTSRDVHIVAVGAFLLFVFTHALVVLNGGAGLSLIGERGFFGILTTTLFTVIFGLVFAGLGQLVYAIRRERAEVGTAAGLALGSLVFLLAVQLLNALSLYNQYVAV